MGVKFTDEQMQVIKLRDRNILVSAAAGSGKTAVLVERIIARLTRDEHPIGIDELLIVTYTEAAAAEMKERIQSAIEKALEEEPGNVHLQKQSTLLHQAKITTIHGFCLSVIRDYFHVIDLDPGFRIAEDGELRLLKHDVAENLIEQKYEEADPEYLSFVESYASGKDDRNLEELILQLFEFSRSYPNPKSWLNMCVEQYDVTDVDALEACPFIQEIMEEVKRHLRAWMSELDYGISLCQSEDGPVVYTETLQGDRRMLSELEKIQSFGEMQQAFSTVKWARMAPNRDKSVDELKLELVKRVREGIKDAWKKMTAQFFYDSASEMQKDMLASQSNMRVLAELVVEFSDAFTEKKRGRNMIDFGDMERYALEILTREEDGKFFPSSVAEELQAKFAEVMIDEYQDSNLIQEAILTSVSKVSKNIHNVFMVGDVKQSIYRFRLSRSELFMEKYHTYSTEESEKQRIDLSKNFRSRKEVLHSTNFVFEQIMTKEFGGITYDDRAALHVGASYEETNGNETEVLLLSGSDLLKQEQMEQEAYVIANRIRELVGAYQIFDKNLNAYRQARYGDVVILMRSLQGWSDTVAEILNDQGIPARINSQESYFQTREIKLLLDYLQVLDNPRQDIPLAAVLRSMFGNLTNEELAIVKSFEKEGTLYECICAYRKQGTKTEIKEKLNAFLNQLQVFRLRVPYTAIHELLWEIMEETGYKDYASALPGGAQRSANLEMLLSKAIAFEKTSYKGLFSFVRYIEQLHKYNVDYGEASLGEEHTDSVKLMSIHKSKGLEFPIVILAGIGKQFNTRDSKASIVVHPDLGIGIDRIDAARRVKCPTIIRKAIQRRLILENAAEELRVLYVAMTRAREKLILVGSGKNLEDYIMKYAKIGSRDTIALPYDELTKANRYLDWIVPALYRNKCFANVLQQFDIPVPFGNPLFQLEVPFFVKVIDAFEVEEAEVEETFRDQISRHILEKWDTTKTYDQEMESLLETQFSYQYPYDNKQVVKQKMSVSELKKQAYEDELGMEVFKEEDVIPLLPQFLQEESELSGALRGTAYHRILELMDFTKEYTTSMIQNDIEVFVKKGLMEEELAACVKVSDIEAFLNSDIGKRVHQASKIGSFHAEQPFVLGVPASEVYKEESLDETVLVQGIIDVYFEEAGELVVLDYKTDKVRTGQELVERYHAQLDYYGKALERLTGKRVKEKLIYSFTLQKEIIL